MKSTTIQLLVIMCLLVAGLVYKGCNEDLLKVQISQQEQTIAQLQQELTAKDNELTLCHKKLKRAKHNEAVLSSITDGYKQLAENWEILAQQYLELYFECLYQCNP